MEKDVPLDWILVLLIVIVENFNNAIKIYKQELHNGKDKAAELCAYANLGYAYRCFGKLDEAINSHCKERKIAIDLHDKAAKWSAYANPGIAYHKAEKYDTIEREKTRFVTYSPGGGLAYETDGDARRTIRPRQLALCSFIHYKPNKSLNLWTQD